MNRIEFVLVLMFTFFVIVVWITSEVILAKPVTPEDPKLTTMLESLTPNFDTKTLELVNSTKLELPNRTIRQTPNPTPRPTPLSLPNSLASPTPTATSSSTLFGNNNTTAGSTLNTEGLTQ